VYWFLSHSSLLEKKPKTNIYYYSKRILFLLLQIVNEMASAAGMPCNIDPQLCAALRSQKTGRCKARGNTKPPVYWCFIYAFLMLAFCEIFCFVWWKWPVWLLCLCCTHVAYVSIQTCLMIIQKVQG
jgi:hypothetical protein